MAKPSKKRKRLARRLFNKNRLVILNEDTFEEIFSLRLTLMNVFVVATLGAIVIIFVTTYIIAFTPLREYIPGYASEKLRREATQLALKSDSLQKSVEMNEAYIASIRKILTGDLEYAKLNKEEIIAAAATDTSLRLNASESELELREIVNKEDKYNLFEQANPRTKAVFYAPVKGSVTRKFDAREHFAVDVAVAKNTPIKSVLEGNVFFADWTSGAGNVIMVRHNDDFISVYKHAASLTKNTGDHVRAGEVIALAGSTGSTATAVHLHFELWKNGYAIDPEPFIAFE